LLAWLNGLSELLGSGRRKSWAARKKSGREGPQLKRREGE
jgi:hypothetical protein